MAFDLPPLPYAYDALEPVLSAHEVKTHYEGHTAKYFEVMNELIKGTAYDKYKHLTDLVNRNTLTSMEGKLFNNACQAWNHVFYWNGLAPEGKTGDPSTKLIEAIDEAFGSFDKFKKKFNEAATGQFGSGWAWLVWRNDKLAIKATPNAANPLAEVNSVPLLTVDVWEHAYLYDPQYAADRKSYVEKMWRIINWNHVNEQFTKATS